MKLLDKMGYRTHLLQSFRATKRRMGPICFIGEAFKLGLVLKTMISVVCTEVLYRKRPLDFELEALCILLKTIGVMSEPFMERDFPRIRQLSSDYQIPMRLRFMLQVSL